MPCSSNKILCDYIKWGANTPSITDLPKQGSIAITKTGQIFTSSGALIIEWYSKVQADNTFIKKIDRANIVKSISDVDNNGECQVTMLDGTTAKFKVSANVKDIRLKSGNYNKTTGNLELVIGNATDTNDDQTILIDAKDLLPVNVDKGLEGDGSSTNKLSVKLSTDQDNELKFGSDNGIYSKTKLQLKFINSTTGNPDVSLNDFKNKIISEMNGVISPNTIYYYTGTSSSSDKIIISLVTDENSNIIKLHDYRDNYQRPPVRNIDELLNIKKPAHGHKVAVLNASGVEEWIFDENALTGLKPNDSTTNKARWRRVIERDSFYYSIPTERQYTGLYRFNDSTYKNSMNIERVPSSNFLRILKSDTYNIKLYDVLADSDNNDLKWWLEFWTNDEPAWGTIESYRDATGNPNLTPADVEKMFYSDVMRNPSPGSNLLQWSDETLTDFGRVFLKEGTLLRVNMNANMWGGEFWRGANTNHFFSIERTNAPANVVEQVVPATSPTTSIISDITAGTNISIDKTDPSNPIISSTSATIDAYTKVESDARYIPSGGVVAGTGILVDNTNGLNPKISVSNTDTEAASFAILEHLSTSNMFFSSGYPYSFAKIYNPSGLKGLTYDRTTGLLTADKSGNYIVNAMLSFTKEDFAANFSAELLVMYSNMTIARVLDLKYYNDPVTQELLVLQGSGIIFLNAGNQFGIGVKHNHSSSLASLGFIDAETCARYNHASVYFIAK